AVGIGFELADQLIDSIPFEGFHVCFAQRKRVRMLRSYISLEPREYRTFCDLRRGAVGMDQPELLDRRVSGRVCGHPDHEVRAARPGEHGDVGITRRETSRLSQSPENPCALPVDEAHLMAVSRAKGGHRDYPRPVPGECSDGLAGQPGHDGAV